MRKALYIILGIIIIAILYLCFYPTDLHPVSYSPPSNSGLTGDFATNSKLQSTFPLLRSQRVGPEDIAIGPDSLLYTAYEDGSIFKFNQDGYSPIVFDRTEGRPLGLKFDHLGNLIVA
ncbi:MAG: hypothetical protein ACJA01_002282 [Saprospiraceae bacterium]|jgi:hypothetical protein